MCKEKVMYNNKFLHIYIGKIFLTLTKVPKLINIMIIFGKIN